MYGWRMSHDHGRPLSEEGQVPLPADLRRRLGLAAGVRLELSEEFDELGLRVLPIRPLTDITNLAGMIKAPSHRAPHRLEDFDPASLLARGHDLLHEVSRHQTVILRATGRVCAIFNEIFALTPATGVYFSLDNRN